MESKSITLAEAREQEYLGALRVGGSGFAAVLVGALAFYFTRFGLPPALLLPARVLCGLVIVVGAGLICAGLFRSIKTSNLPATPFFCPYCNGKNLFTARPKADFDCEHCNRTVHFLNGEPAPVRAVECMNCHALHRVPVTLTRYVCDQCNALMEMSAETEVAAASYSSTFAGTAAQQSYDIVLTAFDPETAPELTALLQNLLVVSMEEAERLLGTISYDSPLVVGYALPERRAETVLLQMRDLGANVRLRPASGSMAVA